MCLKILSLGQVSTQQKKIMGPILVEVYLDCEKLKESVRNMYLFGLK